MTDAATLAGQLAAAGLDDEERAAKTRLFRRTLDRWGREVGSTPAAAWWVPGRLEVFGTHTDYAGGRSLVAPVPRGFVFLAATRADGQIRAIDAKGAGGIRTGPEHDTVAILPGHAPSRFRGWRHYVEVTAARLARNFPNGSLGTEIVFASDLPRAAGMSSSSALIVGMATALVESGNLRARAEWKTNVHSPVDEAGYLGCVENGRDFGTLAGDAGVGTHGGSEDHAAMLAGAAGACTEFAFVPLRHLDTVPVPDGWTFVIASSGIGSHKTGSEREAYNRLSAGTAALLELWNRHERPSDSLGAALASSSSALERLRAIAERSDVPGWTKSALRDRLDHFAREDARVAESVVALRRGDAETFGRLAAESHMGSERLLRNQVPETSALVRVALEAGAFGARSFGAGFGGSVWAVIESSNAADDRKFVERWMAAYRAACPGPAARSIAFVSKPGPPVTKVM